MDRPAAYLQALCHLRDILNFGAMPTVFLGSTYEDLREHRQAVLEAAGRLGSLVRAMEFFGARPGVPKDECLDMVRRSDVYIGLFAMRYGSVDRDSGKSISHLEYLEARSLNLPTLIYLIDERNQPVLPVHVDTGAAAKHLKKLKDELLANHTVGYFTSPDNLAKQVAFDLPALLQRTSGIVGEPNILAELVEALPRIDWLSDQRWSFLESQISAANKSGVPDRVLRGVVEFLLSDDRLTAAYLLAKAANFPIRKAIDRAVAIEQDIAKVVTSGVQAMKRHGQNSS